MLALISVLPEHSTEVGDLIQPVPGVLYEDSKLKKGDPRRYQVNPWHFLACLSSYRAEICLLIDGHVKIYQFSRWQPAIEAYRSTRWSRRTPSRPWVAAQIERCQQWKRQWTRSTNSQITSVGSHTADHVRFEHIICLIYSLFSSSNYFFKQNISDRFFFPFEHDDHWKTRLVLDAITHREEEERECLGESFACQWWRVSFSRASSSIARMMIVALLACVCQSLETQMATFFYSFLSSGYNTEDVSSPSKVTPFHISSALALPILFRIYLFSASPYPSGCRCSWVMSIIVVHRRRGNT